MSLVLERAVEKYAELVLRCDLTGQPHERDEDVLIDDRRAAVRQVGVGDALIDRHVAERTEKPELVPDDGAAECRVIVPDVLDACRQRQSLCPQRWGEVVGLPAFFSRAEVHRATEHVAAIARNMVHPNAARRDLRELRAGRERDLLEGRLIQVILNGAVVEGGSEEHAVNLHGGVELARPVYTHVDLLHHLLATDIRLAQSHALREITERLRVARRRQGVEKRSTDDVGFLRRLHVHDRRLARHRHRLLQRADRQLPVDRHRKVRRQLDTLSHNGREAHQAKRQLVSARPQLDDRVAALSVGHRRPGTFDQRRAASFNRDAGQHRPTGVGDRSRKYALRRGPSWQQREPSQTHEQRPTESVFPHRCLPPKKITQVKSIP